MSTSRIAKLIVPDDPRRLEEVRKHWWELLDDGHLDRILRRARAYRPDDLGIRAKVELELSYLDSNRDRMH